jgi:hypothetical protein
MLWMNGHATEQAPMPAIAEPVSTMKSRRVVSPEFTGEDCLEGLLMKHTQQIIVEPFLNKSI